ncbi:MAG TPA: hypothetical protein VL899_09405 [Alphaproteobacteria bacterium]|jgi:hypothetical protein|nr:hypothetical protein [Alphaproteobacteria bacterium]
MTLRPAAALGLVLVAGSAMAQSAPEPKVPVVHSAALPGVDMLPTDPRLKPIRDRLCGKNPCRNGVSFTLKVSGKPDYTFKNDFGGPYLFQGAIFIFPGETLHFEAEIGPSGLTDLAYAAQPKHPERAIAVTLAQRPDSAGGYASQLTVVNPFPQALAFSVMKVQPGGSADVAADICPVSPHGTGRKTWQVPISEIVISNLGIVSNDAAYTCGH